MSTLVIPQLQNLLQTFDIAKSVAPEERSNIAVQAISKTFPISDLATQYSVSRKFVYRQKDIAQEALKGAFENKSDESKEEIIFNLPVTTRWLHQFVIAAALLCHSSYRV